MFLDNKSCSAGSIQRAGGAFQRNQAVEPSLGDGAYGNREVRNDAIPRSALLTHSILHRARRGQTTVGPDVYQTETSEVGSEITGYIRNDARDGADE